MQFVRITFYCDLDQKGTYTVGEKLILILLSSTKSENIVNLVF